jgi:hypothetical protein
MCPVSSAPATVRTHRLAASSASSPHSVSLLCGQVQSTQDAQGARAHVHILNPAGELKLSERSFELREAGSDTANTLPQPICV